MPNKVAVVTGGNKGIGYAIVRGLCKQLSGYDVLLTARDEGRGRAAVEKLQKEDNVSPKFYQLDITSVDSIKRLKQHLQETYGGLDILVNNAGIAYKAASTAPFSEQAEVSVATNFTGTLNVCKELFPILRTGARVVHVSSRVSTMSLGKVSKEVHTRFTTLSSLPDLEKELAAFVAAAKEGTHEKLGYAPSAYGMSKVGVTVMTPIQQTAIDGDTSRSDILINSCCPGYVDTDMTSHKGNLTIDQGADTPIWLATLPAGAKEPKGNFCAERKIIDWRVSKGW